MPAARESRSAVAEDNLAPSRRPFRAWLLTLAALTAAFGWPLLRLVRFAAGSEMYSHLLIVPVVSAVLLWLDRDRLKAGPRDLATTLVTATAALALLGAYVVLGGPAAGFGTPEALDFSIGAYVLLMVAASAFCLGRAFLRQAAFALAFLILLVPLPTALVNVMETLLQYGSAAVASAFLSVAGTPVLREDLLFHLPGISLQVAPECSGLRSTLALFVTSLVAGYVVLESPWKRALLVAVVIPIALLRNGFRVFTIAELCVHISPTMIDSAIHHHGGPLFFVLSLIPFLLLLRWLMRAERSAELRAKS